MLYSSQKEWYFIHVPKNAGTSIVRPNRSNPICECLEPNAEVYHNKNDYWSQYEVTKNLTPVAILRNPWDRALSIYTYNLKQTGKNLSQDWAKIDHGRLIYEGFKRSWMPGGFFVDGHGREVEYSKESGRAWGQDDDQYSWLDGKGKWFRMEDQMNDFCQFTGLPIPEKLNTTTRSHYRNYYDKELQSRIADLFARDIELGGYKF